MGCFRLMEVYERMTFLSALSVILLEMVTISGVLASGWQLTYHQMHICAAKGSTVDMSCTYRYPERLTVQQAFWTTLDSQNPPDLINDQNYRERITARCEDLQRGPCSLTIQRVKQGDDVMYYCRITTNEPTQKWLGKPGVTLRITDLQVQGAQNTKEGQSMSLTCQTTCTLSGSPSFIWSKDGHPLENRQLNELRLNPVSYEDEGNYTCAVSAEHPSPEFTLNVEYSPKETTVSVSPSGQVVEGSQVNMTCSSKANPPVSGYTWYKRSGEDDVQIGEGEIFTFTQLALDNAGLYSCEANNTIGHQKSPTIDLNVLYPPRNTVVSMNPSTQMLEGANVILTCMSDANPPVENYTWFKVNEPIPVGSGEQYNITSMRSEDGGLYYCEARNIIGSNQSFQVQLDVIADSQGMWKYIYIAIAAACGVMTLLCVALLWIRCHNGDKESTRKDKNQDEAQYANVGFQGEDGATGPPSAVAAGGAEERAQYANLHPHGSRQTAGGEEGDGLYSSIQPDRSRESGEAQGDNVQYASIQPKGSRQTARAVDDEAQYASVEPKHTRQTAGDQGDDVQYASIQFKKATAAEGTPVQADQEDSVIYSGVQSQHPSS